MIDSLRARQARLRGQALQHLVSFGAITGVAVLLIGLVSFYVTERQDILQRRESLREHYLDQLMQLDTAWAQSAEQVLARIEFSRLLEATANESNNARISAFLNAQWAFLDFPNILLLDAKGKVRYRYGPVAHALDPAQAGDGDWHLAASHDELFREFRLPVWLGSEGQGSLVLFRPLNAEALRKLVIPDVHLEAYVGRRELVRSHPELAGEETSLRHDTIGKLGQRYIEVEVPWPGVDSADKPTLKAYRLVPENRLAGLFLLLAFGGIVAMMLLLWVGIGRWLGATVRRIEAVDQALDDYASGQIGRVEIAVRLEQAHARSDEICALADAFEQMTATVERRDAEQRIFIETMAMLDEAVLDLDFDGRILHASPGWSRLCHSDDSVGRPLIDFVVQEDGGVLQRECEALRSGEKERAGVRLRLLADHGMDQWVEARFVGFRDAAGNVVALRGVLRDVSQSYQHERQITHMALHDALTGLPNRVLLEDRFKVALRLAKRSGHHAAVCFLDLDNFKVVNDTLGHKVGDALLIAFANLLRGLLRSGDTLARWGGDEFVLLLPDMESVAAIREVTAKIAQVVQAPLNVDGTEIRVTFSMGATVFPEDGEDMEQLFSQADRAMFYAKAQGRNQVCLFTDMSDKGLGKKDLYIQSSLALAINENRIQAWFQPLISSGNGRCIGAEALARWHDDDLGWISPATFIPMAENIGLIRELGSQVWLASLMALRGWRDAGHADLRLSINISKRQLFIASLAQSMLDDLVRFGLTPADIVLEITESVALTDVAHAMTRLTELRAAGFSLAIDDFGTGYSSLSQLHEMPFDELKIDMSFVRRIHDPKGLSMVQSIAQIAHNLGMKSVAEGVEDTATASRLRHLGVDVLQGYLYGKPMPQDEFTAWLANR